jgi:hypothetical protein
LTLSLIQDAPFITEKLKFLPDWIFSFDFSKNTMLREEYNTIYYTTLYRVLQEKLETRIRVYEGLGRRLAAFLLRKIPWTSRAFYSRIMQNPAYKKAGRDGA